LAPFHGEIAVRDKATVILDAKHYASPGNCSALASVDDRKISNVREEVAPSFTVNPTAWLYNKLREPYRIAMPCY